MVKLDDADYPSCLEKIQFGTLWGGAAGWQGWSIDGVDDDTSLQLLMVALYQMSDSEADFDEISKRF